MSGFSLDSIADARGVEMSYIPAKTAHVQKYKGITLVNFPNTWGWNYNDQQTHIDLYGRLPDGLVNCAPIEKENNMHIQQDVALTENKARSQALQRFTRRVEIISNDHDTTLRHKYHIDAWYPRTLGEMVAKIKKGEFKFEEGWDEETEFNPYHGLSNYFLFDMEKADSLGFKKARKALDAAVQEAVDKLFLYTDKEGSEEKVLKIIKEFENWKD